MSLFDEASLVLTPNAFKAGKLYAVKGADLDVTRATSATRVNANGSIETVWSNVPRIDYSGGGCPSILVEPQRTNLVLYSEDFSNINWVALNSSVNVNTAVSPNNTSTADLILENTTNGVHQNYQIIAVGNVNLTSSIFVKKQNNKFVQIQLSDFATGDISVTFNFDTQSVESFVSSGTWSNASYSITPFQNGWFKISMSGLKNTGAIAAFVVRLLNSSQSSSYSGNASNGVYVWGAQLEAGSYATSYIPTVASSVTRNADVISKTGISDLIGQTEGTIFVEEIYNATVVNVGGVDDTLVSLSDGTSNNLISIFHYGSGGGSDRKVLFFIRLSGTTQVAIYSDSLPSGTYKIALAYKNNDVIAYINGTQIGTDTTATIPATSAITLVDPITTNAATKKVNIKSVSHWKTRLTNAELAELTTL